MTRIMQSATHLFDVGPAGWMCNVKRRRLGWPVLIVVSVLSLCPFLAAAQTNVDDHGGAPFDLTPWLDAHATRVDTTMFGAEFATAGHPPPRGSSPDWLRTALANETHRTLSGLTARRLSSGEQSAGQRQRSWIGRHPALVGALVGFGGGFVIGYASGRDGVFDDQDAAFSAWVLGGVGAGAGALVGVIVGAIRH